MNVQQMLPPVTQWLSVSTPKVTIPVIVSPDTLETVLSVVPVSQNLTVYTRPVWTQNNTIYPTVQTLMSVSSTWTTVTTMLTVLTLLGASTVPVCLVTLELDSSVVCDYPLARICSKGYNSCLICLSFIHSVC